MIDLRGLRENQRDTWARHYTAASAYIRPIAARVEEYTIHTLYLVVIGIDKHLCLFCAPREYGLKLSCVLRHILKLFLVTQACVIFSVTTGKSRFPVC